MLRILHLTTRLRREPPLKGKPFVKFASTVNAIKVKN